MHASLFQQLQAWLAGDIAADYGISRLHAAAGVAGFSSQPPAVHFNPLGGVHGGYIATLFDAALGLAVYSQACAGEVYVTASLQVNYLRPIGLAALPLSTEARVQQRDGRQVSVQATLHDAQGQLCANASGVFTCLRHAPSGFPRLLACLRSNTPGSVISRGGRVRWPPMVPARVMRLDEKGTWVAPQPVPKPWLPPQL